MASLSCMLMHNVSCSDRVARKASSCRTLFISTYVHIRFSSCIAHVLGAICVCVTCARVVECITYLIVHMS